MYLNEISLVKIDESNITIFQHLAQAYEAEFSTLTQKLPDERGLFKVEPETLPNESYTGYLLYYKHKIPVGFCIVTIDTDINDVAEFYVIPIMRRKQFGSKLARMVFDLHPGKWQVRQIEGAEHAIHFWRNVIKSYTQDQYHEAVVHDEDWGYVTRQQFTA